MQPAHAAAVMAASGWGPAAASVTVTRSTPKKPFASASAAAAEQA
jgi:hypothetical protein